MKNFIFLCVLSKCISAQEYTISIFGLPIAEVKQTRSHHSTISFETRNTGIADLIWPAKNFYSAQFDSASFGIRGWDKKIRQGEFKKKLSVNFNPATIELIYGSKNKVQITDKTQTIFTLLAMVQTADYRELDTHCSLLSTRASWGRHGLSGLILPLLITGKIRNCVIIIVWISS